MLAGARATSCWAPGCIRTWEKSTPLLRLAAGLIYGVLSLLWIELKECREAREARGAVI